MSIEALILGKLHEPAKSRTSGNTGRQFVTAKVLAAAGDAGGVFVNVVAFSDTACRVLLALDAGDSVALAGTLKPGAWIDRNGDAKPQIDLVAAQVLTTYGVKKKRDAVAAAGSKGSDLESGPSGSGIQKGHSDLKSESAASLDDDEAWLRGGE